MLRAFDECAEALDLIEQSFATLVVIGHQDADAIEQWPLIKTLVYTHHVVTLWNKLKAKDPLQDET